MKKISRSVTIEPDNSSYVIYTEAVKLLDKVDRDTVRLIGVGIHNISTVQYKQLSLFDLNNNLDKQISILRNKYNLDFTDNNLYKMIELMRKEQRNENFYT